MKIQLIFFFLWIQFLSISVQAQVTPSIEWQKCLGGTYEESATSIQQTIDNGFIVAGRTMSNDGDVSGKHGNYDYWLIKLNSEGDLLWQKCLGGSEDDEANSIQQTSDTGYIVAGFTFSNDGDVTDNHGMYDAWIIKLDESSNLLWQKSLGGTFNDYATAVREVNDGYIIAGYTGSNDGDVSGWHYGFDDYFGVPYYDAWIVKLDFEGNIQWQKCLGGSKDDLAQKILALHDGNYLIVGSSKSNDGDVSGHHGSEWWPDYWVAEIDSVGNVLWQKSYGSTGDEQASDVIPVSGNQFTISGTAAGVIDGDITEVHGWNDCWILRIDSVGNLLWQKSLGGSYDELANSIIITSEGNFVVTGSAGSNDGDVTGNHGSTLSADFWIVQLDSSGTLMWQACLGGTGVDESFSVYECTDSTLVVAGYSGSDNNDVSGNHLDYFGNATQDFWIVKLSNGIGTGVTQSFFENCFSAFPNPTSTAIYINHEFHDPTLIGIYNLLGEEIKEQKVFGGNVMIDVCDLPAGIYFIRSKDRTISKFVKE
ncbi:MAG: T9SS type A sorting domain-containing protein [Chitinophagales bacterium]|nr:T9SS type A sorting domain-containing protein [Chitinophagales bacterium]